MKIALLNDTHFGCRNDSPAFLKFQTRFYKDIFFPYLIENDIKTNQTSIQSVTRHTFGLFTGIKGSKNWKRYLNKIKFMKGNVKNIILNGMNNIDND